MKPLYLEIEGFNSFRDNQKIDFSKLVERGLFGIFGPTGSGKSSILDAIIYALYGKTERDIINLSEEKAVVKYTFEIGANNGRSKYLIHRAVKRDKDGALKPTVTKLFCYKTREEEEVLELDSEGKTAVDSRILEIIGLKQNDFTRAVVLPQGKFSEFLKLTARDRSDMLERLFGLQKYGSALIDKVKAAVEQSKSQLLLIDGQLASYSNVNESEHKLLKEKYEIAKGAESNLKLHLTKTRDEYDKYKVIWQLQEELLTALRNYDELELKGRDVEGLRNRLLSSNYAKGLIPLVKRIEEDEETLKKVSSTLDIKSGELTIAEENLERLKLAYENSYNERAEKSPKLAVLIEDLQRAVRMENTLLNANAEYSALSEEVIILVGRKEKGELLRLKLTEELKAIVIELNKITSEIKDVTITIDERKLIGTGTEKEMDLRKSNEEIAKLNNNLMLHEAKHNDCVVTIDRLKLQNNEIEKQLELTKLKIKELKSDLPLGNNELLERQQRINILQQNIDNKNKLLKFRNEKDVEKQNYLKQIEEGNLVAAKIGIELSEISERLKLESQILENLKVENYAGLLAASLANDDPCPVCGNTHKIKLASMVDEHVLNEKMQLVQELSSIHQGLNQQLNTVQRNGAVLEENNRKLFEEIEILNLQISDFDAELESEALIKLQLDFENEKLKYERWESSSMEADELFKSLTSSSNAVAIVLATELSNLNSTESFMNTIKAELLKEVEKKSLIEEDLINLKDGKEICFKDRYDAVMECDFLKAQYEARFEELLAEKEKSEQVLKKCENELQDIHSLHTLKIEKLNNKHADICDIKDEILRLSEGNEPKAYLELAMTQMTSIENNERDTKLAYDGGSFATMTLDKKINLLKASKESALNSLTKGNEQLITAMRDTIFNSSEEVKNAYLSEEESSQISEDIKQYDDMRLLLVNRISQIKDLLKDDNIEEDMWINLQDKLKIVQEKVDLKIGEVSALHSSIEQMEIALEKVSDIIRERNIVQNKRDLLAVLEKNFKGNKFVEFVAQAQLKYVTAEASRRLKNNTNDKYELKLNDEGEFFVKDNISGGLARSINSLSGGELFLTSLALALALSSHIQLRGAASLEFFFLDEGFGTLDEELLDTVINSLETLHSEKLSVGIITHVKELKERVPIKINVTPSTFGYGSKAIIET